jgi:hypothetical protein
MGASSVNPNISRSTEIELAAMSASLTEGGLRGLTLKRLSGRRARAE